MFVRSGNYSGGMGLDLKRHIDEQSMGSPTSGGETSDSMHEPDVKRVRTETTYDAE